MEQPMFRVFLASIGVFFFLLATPIGAPTSAEARVSVNIHVGSNISNGRRITCSEGRWMLERRGFRDVRARDCRGRFFTYSGRRSGSWWWIDVRSSDGRVMNMSRRDRW
jgi:hypothetical protein